MIDRDLARFDAEIYRRCNRDLQDRSDAECRAHFEVYGRFEPRMFGCVDTTRERFSMRWLRGRGIEIGAGNSPLPLFGETTVRHADADPSLKFGGERADDVFSLDDPALFERMAGGAYDFAVASHVLEHVDSLLHGLRNLIGLVRPGGFMYAAVPSSEFDHDGTWMPRFEFDHHVEELADPLRYARLHDELVVAVYRRVPPDQWPRDAFHDDAFHAAVAAGRLPANGRFPHHKHSYDFQEWTRILIQSLDYLGQPARLVDSAFGAERMDCHFVLQRH